MSDFLSLTLVGVDGSRWDISGPNAGEQDVELLPKPKQFFDSPAITYWIKSGGALEKYQGFSFKRRDPLFGLVIFGAPNDQAETHSQLRQALGMYDQEFRLEATTYKWGTRSLTMRLLEQPTAYESGEWEGKDPHLFGASTLTVSAAAAQPHWTSTPETASWTLTSGTSGSGTLLLPGNPGDIPTFPRWGLNAPARWTLPDRSWGQEADFNRPVGADATRTVPVPALVAGEDSELDTNDDHEYIIAANGAPVWMRTLGKFAYYPIAPYTVPTTVPISVTAATAGVTATVEVDRWYSRPWGVSL